MRRRKVSGVGEDERAGGWKGRRLTMPLIPDVCNEVERWRFEWKEGRCLDRRKAAALDGVRARLEERMLLK